MTEPLLEDVELTIGDLENKTSQGMHLLEQDFHVLDIILNPQRSPIPTGRQITLITDIISRQAYTLLPVRAGLTMKQIKEQELEKPLNPYTFALNHTVSMILAAQPVKQDDAAYWPLFNNLITVFQKSYPSSFYNWTEEEIKALDKLFIHLRDIKEMKFIDRFVNYLNQLLTTQAIKREYTGPQPTMAKKYRDLTVFVKSANYKLVSLKTYYPHYVLTQVEKLGLDPSLPEDWVEQLIDLPVKAPVKPSEQNEWFLND